MAQHPGGSVPEITARTGQPQSAVSAAVARLQEAGAILTESDPRDRCRTLAWTNPAASGKLLVVTGAPSTPPCSTPWPTRTPSPRSRPPSTPCIAT